MSVRDCPTRRDVHRVLRGNGWQELPHGALSKGQAVFASVGRRRESVLRLADAHPDFTIEFSALIPANIIIAACVEAAA